MFQVQWVQSALDKLAATWIDADSGVAQSHYRGHGAD